MCGILGVLNNKDLKINKRQVKDAAIFMQHRGPDAFAQWGIPNKIELAHLRLSIIDLSKESNQPFFSSCGNYVVVFNGEIFNYVEIAEELSGLGINFRTKSDTEVLLNAYVQWGEKCVLKFNGDWAFAIYNIKDNVLFCSRDRFGVKPFNYALVNGEFIFASEIKSILSYFPSLRVPNYNIISNYCRNSLGAHTSETWFNGIIRLLPAHNLIWDNGEIFINKYWEYPTNTLKDITLEEASKTYRDLFINAVNIRMRSDVPVGTTLSSGLDSSSIVSVVSKFHGPKQQTFTAEFKDANFDKLEKLAYRGDIEIDESVVVRRLASNLDLDSYFIENIDLDFVNELSNIIYHLESGHSSYATIPLSKVLDFAKEKVTVIMEGQGADELLGGYVLKSFPYLVFEYLKRGNFKMIMKEYFAFKKYYSIGQSLKLLFRLFNNDLIERIYSLMMGRNKVYGPKLKKYSRVCDYPIEPPNFDDGFNRELFKSHTGGLVNLLHYGDAISMSKSVESRNPFMDIDLVEFAFRLPFNFKMQNGLGKYIHRVSMIGIVPDFILNNPLKFGFITPLSIQFDSFDNKANQVLLSKKCLERGLFDEKGIRSLISSHIKKQENNAPLLFRLLSVELWFRRFID